MKHKKGNLFTCLALSKRANNQQRQKKHLMKVNTCSGDQKTKPFLNLIKKEPFFPLDSMVAENTEFMFVLCIYRCTENKCVRCGKGSVHHCSMAFTKTDVKSGLSHHDPCDFRWTR